MDEMDSLVKENQLLKQQLQNYYLKVAKTQKVNSWFVRVPRPSNQYSFVCIFQLEEEVTNIYRVHEELKQTCERREKLERAARMRLQSDLQRVQELNCVMKDQVDILQSQLLAPSEHQILIAQLFTQSKSPAIPISGYCLNWTNFNFRQRIGCGQRATRDRVGRSACHIAGATKPHWHLGYRIDQCPAEYPSPGGGVAQEADVRRTIESVARCPATVKGSQESTRLRKWIG